MKPAQSKEELRPKNFNINNKMHLVAGVGKDANSHVNYGYDLTLKNDLQTTPPLPTSTVVNHININNNEQQATYANAKPTNVARASSSNGPVVQVQTRKASFSIQNLNELIRNSIKENRVFNLKRESSQLLPHSIERQMAKNFQNIKTTSTAVPVAAKYPDAQVTHHNHHQPSSSLETSIENNNHISKYTDSTSLPSNTEQSLKDEDAWLPILNIAEEQVYHFKGQHFF